MKEIHDSVDPPSPQTYPLRALMKCMAVFLPLLTCPAILALIIVSSHYNAAGQKRRAREFQLWFVGGLLFWISAGFLLEALHAFH